MLFHECKDIIANHLDAWLRTILVGKGLDVRGVALRHREILNQFKDQYSRALLMKDLPKEEAPTFSNIPRLSFKWDISDKLEDVFHTLKLPATQQCAHRIASQLRTKPLSDVLTAEQLASLEQVPFIKEAISKETDWLIRAHRIMIGMCNNLPLLSSATEEEKAFSKLLEFDWYYDYSDDIGVWRAGKAHHARAVLAIRAALGKEPSLIKVVTAIANSGNFPITFFTDMP